MFSGIAGVALPLSSEFGITREIDDRVMCPLPLWTVALEKVCFSAMQSIVAALLVIPMARYIPAVPVRADIHNWFLLALVLVLASLLAGSLGLVIGSTVNPKQIGLVFSIIVVPITFLGCVYYPWAWLRTIPWLKYGVLFNPIVYMSEGLRAAVSFHRAHALVGDPGGAVVLHRRAGPLGPARIPGKSAVVGSCRFLHLNWYTMYL
jgi:ABC-2 type transport system permease protein